MNNLLLKSLANVLSLFCLAGMSSDSFTEREFYDSLFTLLSNHADTSSILMLKYKNPEVRWRVGRVMQVHTPPWVVGGEWHSYINGTEWVLVFSKDGSFSCQMGDNSKVPSDHGTFECRGYLLLLNFAFSGNNSMTEVYDLIHEDADVDGMNLTYWYRGEEHRTMRKLPSEYEAGAK